MANLLLPSLEIQNFRAFEHLRIERLGRVNLITGKNNVGKTSLLEALYLYARGASAYQILNLLDARDELPRRVRGNSYTQFRGEDKSFSVQNLFYGRDAFSDSNSIIKVGTAGSDKEGLLLQLSPIPESTLPTAELVRQTAVEGFEGKNIPVPHLLTKTKGGFVRRYPVYRLLDSSFDIHLESPDSIKCVFISTTSNPKLAYPAMWDAITLTPEQNTVLEALHILENSVSDFNYRVDSDAEHGRIPIVRLKGMNQPVPLRSLGEGISRIANIALALTAARDGILLVDEVETGLHYSVMPEVWKLIFQVAQRLNVQVFATTHSWDCIEAFQRAADEDQNEEGLLIRLRERGGEIVPTIFGERELAIVTRDQIEVR